MNTCIMTWLPTNKGGYGNASLDGRCIGHHRLVFLEYNGFLPPVVMHTCDNPGCINPDHLVAGTVLLNIQDRHAKGRSRGQPNGERNSLCKIRDWMIGVIRQLSGRYQDIGHRFCVDKSQIGRIKRGERCEGRHIQEWSVAPCQIVDQLKLGPILDCCVGCQDCVMSEAVL